MKYSYVKKDSRAHAFVFKSFCQLCRLYDAPNLMSSDIFWNQTDALTLFVCNDVLRRLSISFSNSFDMIGSNEIGRYDST
jgi:hypothetical protein